MPDSPGRTLLLVTLAVGSCAAVFSTAFFDGAASGLTRIVGILVFFTAYVLLRRVVQTAADLPDEQLDERERGLRDRSYLQSYRLLGGALACSLVLALVDDAGVVRDSLGEVVVAWDAVLGSLLLLSLVLPSAVLAMRQRAYTRIVGLEGDHAL